MPGPRMRIRQKNEGTGNTQNGPGDKTLCNNTIQVFAVCITAFDAVNVTATPTCCTVGAWPHYGYDAALSSYVVQFFFLLILEADGGATLRTEEVRAVW